MRQRPLFTVVTPAFNCRPFLPRNLASVRAQRLSKMELEHWIIDAGSQDGTVEYLSEQTDVKFISERDRGLSHAVNKGIERARGEWIIWLNGDDELAPNALNQFLQMLPRYPGICVFSGSQRLFGYDGALERVNEGWDYNLKELLGRRTAIVQASTFVHRRVYEQVGVLDETYRYAMDYEWTVRAMHRFRCQPLPYILTHYHRRAGSITDTGMPDSFREILRVRRKYGKSRAEYAEWFFRFYIWTEPLRRILWLRRAVRAAKGWFGHKPLHPVPGA